MGFEPREYLSSRRVPPDTIAAATEHGWLPLLVIDDQLFGSAPRYTAGELADEAGVDADVARLLWRAMGFTETSAEDPVYFSQDLEALQVGVRELAGGTPLDTVARHTRIMNAAVSRIAESFSDELVSGVRSMRETGLSEDAVSEWLLNCVQFDQIDRLLGYFFRRHLRDALWRRLAVPADLVGHLNLTIGFVDLVRFTALTEEIAEDELDSLISRFGDVAHDRITDGGGRMVKMIGDEVMFVAEDAAIGTNIALDLVEAYAADDELPPARAGLSSGDVLSREGDYFGPVVNFASRVVDIARPNTVVTSEAVHAALADDPEPSWARSPSTPGSRSSRLSWRHLPPKRLKGIGVVRLWSVRRNP